QQKSAPAPFGECRGFFWVCSSSRAPADEGKGRGSGNSSLAPALWGSSLAVRWWSARRDDYRHHGARPDHAGPQKRPVGRSTRRTVKWRSVSDQLRRSPSAIKRTSDSAAPATASSTRLRASG